MVDQTATSFTPEENEMLTRVGRGTLMGDLFRQYWIPALVSSDLTPERPQKRVRLLGEDLIAFRTQSGAIGIVGEFCSHRLASLYFGRVEGEAIRCLYHGWLYGREGECLDQGNLSAEHQFTSRIHHTGYKSAEHGGVVWAYMGPAKEPPGLPELEWALVPQEQRVINRFYQACNYLQAMEGGIDPTHPMWLHSPIDLSDTVAGAQQPPQQVLANATGQRTPTAIHIEETEYGFVYGARRDMGDGTSLWRVNQWLLPFFTMPPGDDLRGARMWVPIDDVSSVKWVLGWYPTREAMLVAPERTVTAGEAVGWAEPTSEAYGDVRLRANRANDYLIDWDVHYSKRMGVYGVNLQDICITENEGPGPIMDRTLENLCGADLSIVRARRRLLEAARALRDGTAPPGVEDPSVYRVRGVSAVVPDDQHWLDAIRDAATVPPGDVA